MWNLGPIFVLLLSIIILSSHCHGLSFDGRQRQLLLRSHHRIRAQIAKGVNGRPSVSNMNALSWSEELEKNSQLFGKKCDDLTMMMDDFKFVEGSSYLTFTGLHRVNQNLLDDMARIMENIFANVSTSSMGQCKDSSQCQMIRQVLEPEASLVGCSYSICKESSIIITCTYDKGFTLSPNLELPKSGIACSKCSKEFSHCMDNALCATSSQCYIHSDRQCMSLHCLDKFSYCSLWAERGICFLKTMRNFCPKSCRKCEPNPLQIEDDLKDAAVDCKDKRTECYFWVNKQYCHIKTVQIYCPRGCGLCNLTSERNNKEPTSCRNLGYFCNYPEVQRTCIETCAKLTTAKTLKPFISRSPHQTSSEVLLSPSTKMWTLSKSSPRKYSIEPASCRKMKHLCGNTGVKEICKVTCGIQRIQSTVKRGLTTSYSKSEFPNGSTMITSSTKIPETGTESSLSSSQVKASTEISIDQISCRNISCTTKGEVIVSTKIITKETTTGLVTPTFGPLPSTTYVKPSIDEELIEPPQCQVFKTLCNNPNIKTRCPKTCESTSDSETLTPKTSTPILTLTREPFMCPNMKDLCSTFSVRNLCPKTCGSTSTSISVISTTGSSTSIYTFPLFTSTKSISQNAVPSEPNICKDRKDLCRNPNFRRLCKTTCEEPTSCHNMGYFKTLCNNPNIKTRCPKTCGIFKYI